MDPRPSDSKRINANVKAPPAPGTPAAADVESSNLLRESPLDATIVSALFWPPFACEAPDFKPPPTMQSMMDAYGKRYHHLKAPRQMRWKPTLGTVVVEVMRGDIEIELSLGLVFQRKTKVNLVVFSKNPIGGFFENRFQDNLFCPVGRTSK